MQNHRWRGKPHGGLGFTTARADGGSGPQESEPKAAGLVFLKPGRRIFYLPCGMKDLLVVHKHRWLGPAPRASDSVGLEWGLRMCIHNGFWGNAVV